MNAVALIEIALIEPGETWRGKLEIPVVIPALCPAVAGSYPPQAQRANGTEKSADQYAAEQYGRDTRLPSIELGTERGRGAGSCDSGYAFGPVVGKNPLPRDTVLE